MLLSSLLFYSVLFAPAVFAASVPAGEGAVAIDTLQKRSTDTITGALVARNDDERCSPTYEAYSPNRRSWWKYTFCVLKPKDGGRPPLEARVEGQYWSGVWHYFWAKINSQISVKVTADVQEHPPVFSKPTIMKSGNVVLPGRKPLSEKLKGDHEYEITFVGTNGKDALMEDSQYNKEERIKHKFRLDVPW